MVSLSVIIVSPLSSFESSPSLGVLHSVSEIPLHGNKLECPFHERPLFSGELTRHCDQGPSRFASMIFASDLKGCLLGDCHLWPSHGL